MLDYQIEILDDLWTFFLDNLCIDDRFQAHVRKNRLLSHEAIEEIESKKTEASKVTCFINKLRKQNPRKFNEFLAILLATGQEHIHCRIEAALQCRRAKLPKSPETDENIKKFVSSELIFNRLLSTADRDLLLKQCVLRNDYNKVNELRHIQAEEIAKIESENEQLKRDNDSLNHCYQSADQELKRVLKENTEIDEKCKGLTKNLSLELDKNAKFESETDKLRQNLENYAKLIDELKYKLKEMSERDEENKKKMKKQEKEILKLQEELSQSQNQNRRLSCHMEQLSAIKKDHNDTSTDHSIKKKLETHMNKLNQLINVPAIGTDIQNELKELETTTKQLFTRVNHVEQQNDESHEVKLHESEKNNTNISQKENKTQNDSKKDSKLLNSKDHQTEKRIRKISNGQKSSVRLVEIETDLNDVKKRLSEAQMTIKQMEQSLWSKDKELHKIEREKHRFQRELRQLKDESEMYQSIVPLDAKSKRVIYCNQKSQICPSDTHKNVKESSRLPSLCPTYEVQFNRSNVTSRGSSTKSDELIYL